MTHVPPFRLPRGGRLIDRSDQLGFRFDGRHLRGLRGDTLASALMANGQMMMGRSFKYHRPRGPVASGAEEPNALLGLGQGGRFEPNQRATTTALVAGMVTRSQNCWPSLDADIGAVNGWLAPFLPAGFYYKTFIHPRPFWKHVFEPVIRRSAGLGRAPTDPDPDRYEQAYGFADVVVVGGGIAGLRAARDAAADGGTVTVLEQSPHWGGRTPVDHAGGQAAIDALLSELRAMPHVTLRRNCMATGLYDHGYLIAREALADHDPNQGIPRQRLWRIRAGRVITATGALERPLSFACNDVPGVMLASAMRDFIDLHGVTPGQRIVVATNNDDAYRTALIAADAGLDVAAIVDARPQATGDLPRAVRDRGIEVLTGSAIAKVKGRRHVEAIAVCDQNGGGAITRTVECDAVAMSGGWSPVVHLYSHCGGKLTWDEGQALFRPDPDRPPLGADGQGIAQAVGAANGDLRCAGDLERAEGATMPVWVMPARAPHKLRAKMWLDFQNDVKVTDVELAAREGYASVEHTKRYTTLGMATDQGKLSNINGLAVLSGALDQPIPATGTTTFRPPYTPLTLATIAADARGEAFQPLRKTPMHGWHEAHGASWDPVGHWRRPYAYLQGAEDREAAVAREILAVRKGVGTLDASTLGKIVVKGPDAGRFMDMMYTNMMSTLKVGRCRYGLMCSENGFLMDDGVVARLSDDTWLCHTTTGGADRIHAHMEDWLQCEWWDWKVFTANLTEQYAQIAVAGPQARTLLERLNGSIDLSADALPFMAWAEGDLAGIPARIFRISFSGELSFEIAVPASRGLELWEKLHDAGRDLGIAPYGTEAMHVMRAEKGFIMIGDETDGTIIPQDLGLDWAISKKKADYIGKRAQRRLHMVDGGRWKLVGLESVDGRVLPDGAYAATDKVNGNGQRVTEGRVTSSYHSPTLDRPIAMGLVRHGPSRMGQVLDFPMPSGGSMKARIVDPVFYDKEGSRLNG
ncbi:sarcosine oxidase subunit alpha family protein [Paracoccus sp. 1_MG-2023]|uniref:sarcosine oxidase subunit alpha family protein n=1 Tax=unclassified Paracoccus (in: a-proteobacteria) TaxID=2688777 RepID=UPI001C08380E|nr:MULTISPECIES: sarcosine oxidase subunit alpha family protein [unclassified Paracoccus (in: a-proteobacteria)]MBU2957084.1 sarcosine oxidase subunit alpha family protein [Paracoccus sp. C2R09]MDO6669582.1 sarcosine oxidase subunit alpha family protein [Paracoccus sp. 1_MG-2023]